MNKYKIINDPVYGFIEIPSELVFDVISHPYFQRLRRIRQMGLAELVYPGATHSRFHHVLGAMHLMNQALDVLINKGHHITESEIESALLAILLHDIGHGPFSHTLEATILNGVHHEEVSLRIFEVLNEEFGGKLSKAIEIFKGTYPKHFLHQLVSGQLDTDRMDYLNRDSFYSGVAEGVIGYDRIIKMLDVYDGQLVVEEKGIYSIEKFIVSRRLMYWQAYLHKASIAADHTLVNVLKRAKDLYSEGRRDLFLSPHLEHFFANQISIEDFYYKDIHLKNFVLLDDVDILFSLKMWMNDKDEILSLLSKSLIDRRLFKIMYIEKDIDDILEQKKSDFYLIYPHLKIYDKYLFLKDTAINNAYISGKDSILIKMKDGSIKDFEELTEIMTIKSMSQPMVKPYIFYPIL
ncbi:MAG: HD domain-containing protein [Chitinophagales bacterium]|nr:HD domain-containing protein [Chitinophagales bacterium]MCZ2392801.1 HD domain-containing protein [Chitinophagales bacterium]